MLRQGAVRVAPPSGGVSRRSDAGQHGIAAFAVGGPEDRLRGRQKPRHHKVGHRADDRQRRRIQRQQPAALSRRVLESPEAQNVLR